MIPMSEDGGELRKAIERRLIELKDAPLTVSEMAKLVVVPGPWTLRRLERRGVIPPAKRSLARGDRYYDPSDADMLRKLIVERIDAQEGMK